MSAFDDWDRQTALALEAAYVAAGAGPRGSGAGDDSEGEWRAKRQHLALPMDRSGSWLDVGCANGHLLATLPAWAAERGVAIEAFGLELLAPVAELARSLHPGLAGNIWTGSVMSWSPPRRFTYVTAVADAVPAHHLGDMVARLREIFAEPEGRVIVSAYTNRGDQPRHLFDELSQCGHPPSGRIRIDRPGRHPLITAWIDG